MRCNGCGKKLDDNVTVCPVCGRKQKASPPPAPAPVSSPAPEPRQDYRSARQQVSPFDTMPADPPPAKQTYAPPPRQASVPASAPVQPPPQAYTPPPQAAVPPQQSAVPPQQGFVPPPVPQQGSVPLQQPAWQQVSPFAANASVPGGANKKLPTVVLAAAAGGLLIIVLALVFVFSSKKNMIIGTWELVEVTQPDGSTQAIGNGEYAEMKFDRDGTMKLDDNGNKQNYDYEIDGDTLVLESEQRRLTGVETYTKTDELDIEKLSRNKLVLVSKDSEGTTKLTFERE